MLLIYLLVAAAIPLLFLTRMQGAIYLFAVVFGIGLGGEYMVIPLMAAELFGVRVLGRAMGVVLTGDGVAEALAPVLVGRMHDVSGSYATGFLAVIGFAIAGTICGPPPSRARSIACATAGKHAPKSVPSMPWPVIPYPAALSSSERHANCRSLGVEYA